MLSSEEKPVIEQQLCTNEKEESESGSIRVQNSINTEKEKKAINSEKFRIRKERPNQNPIHGQINLQTSNSKKS